LRRAVPSFTVEVRRRPRLATLNPNAQSSETKPPQGAFDRESPRASAAAFAVKKVDPSPTDVGSSPKGRILPSLVPDEPLRRPLRDAALTAAESDPPSRAPKRPSARGLKGKDQTSNSTFSSGESAQLAERLSTASRQPSSVQPEEGASVSPRVATTEQSQVVGNSGSPARSAKAKRRDESTISRDDARAKPSPNDQRSAIGRDFLATLPLRVEDRSPQSRKRTIMTRYVFGDELKLGERWKRRLLTTR
jgi:hypothetical protein